MTTITGFTFQEMLNKPEWLKAESEAKKVQAEMESLAIQIDTIMQKRQMTQLDYLRLGQLNSQEADLSDELRIIQGRMVQIPVRVSRL